MPEFILLSLAVSSVSFTLSTASIFRWWREGANDLHPKLGELARCPLCLSHWIAFAVVLLLQPQSVVSYFMLVFALVGASSLGHYVMLRAYEPVARMEAQRQIDRLRAATAMKNFSSPQGNGEIEVIEAAEFQTEARQ